MKRRVRDMVPVGEGYGTGALSREVKIGIVGNKTIERIFFTLREPIFGQGMENYWELTVIIVMCGEEETPSVDTTVSYSWIDLKNFQENCKLEMA